MNTEDRPYERVLLILTSAKPFDVIEAIRGTNEETKNALGFKERHKFRIDAYPSCRAEQLVRLFAEHTPTIVHFYCDMNDTGITLLDRDDTARLLDASAVLGNFRLLSAQNVRIVLVTGFNSKTLAKAIVEDERSKVQFAIGSTRKVDNHEAVTFSASFYASLARGNDVYNAFTEAGQQLRNVPSQNVSNPDRNRRDNTFVIFTKESETINSFKAIDVIRKFYTDNDRLELFNDDDNHCKISATYIQLVIMKREDKKEKLERLGREVDECNKSFQDKRLETITNCVAPQNL